MLVTDCVWNFLVVDSVIAEGRGGVGGGGGGGGQYSMWVRSLLSTKLSSTWMVTCRAPVNLFFFFFLTRALSRVHMTGIGSCGSSPPLVVSPDQTGIGSYGSSPPFVVSGHPSHDTPVKTPSITTGETAVHAGPWSSVCPVLKGSQASL